MARRILTVLTITLMMGACNRDWKTTDYVEIIDESKSPDGRHIATVFYCSGGGAAGYVYNNVNLRKSTDQFNQRDFLLGKRLWGSYTNITVRWIDSAHLEVSYMWWGEHPEYKRYNSQRVPDKDGVRITYLLKEGELDEHDAQGLTVADNRSSLCETAFVR